ATGRLDQVDELRWRAGAAVAVVMATEGYPGSPRKGDAISGIPEVNALDDVFVFQAGTSTGADGELVTAGGRVLAVTATGPSVPAARDRAYDGVERISFAGAHYRRDIAARAGQ